MSTPNRDVYGYLFCLALLAIAAIAGDAANVTHLVADLLARVAL
jgi:hypothetical protein